jgi:hypothetical protein
MRMSDDIGFSLMRLRLYEDISKTGQVSEESVIAFRDFILGAPEYTGKPSTIVRSLLKIVTFNMTVGSDDREFICANYLDLLNKIDANIASINIKFFYNEFRSTCAKYNGKLNDETYLAESVVLLEEIEDTIMPDEYYAERVSACSTLLRLYLNHYEKYKDKIYPLKDKLLKLVEQEKTYHVDNLFE